MGQVGVSCCRAAALLCCIVPLCAAAVVGGALDVIRSGSFASGAPAGRELRVLDWNIDRGRAFEQIVHEIEAARPDIAILQEVDLNARRSGRRDVSHDLAARVGLNYAFAPEFQELGQGQDEQPAFHGQALLTSLPVIRTRVLRFKTQSGFWKPRPFLPRWGVMQRRVGGRMALVAELRYRRARLIVYDVHLESRSFGRLQMAQLNEVLADARRYGADAAILIAGDFNSLYNGHALRRRLESAGFRNCFGEKRVRTHVFTGAIDWIAARGPIQLRNAHAHHGIGGSDHFPVTVSAVVDR